MKRSWKVLRTNHNHPESTRRWDRAYQLLVEWAASATRSQPINTEVTDASGDLRPRLHPTPSPGPDHRSATRPPETPRGRASVDTPGRPHLPG